MSDALIVAGPLRFRARFEDVLAPKSCALLRTLLPLEAHIVQARWSGQAAWVPLGERNLSLPPENATVYPAPGQILLYPGGVSETELLFAYGPTRFASKAGDLAGNHVLTIVEGLEQLAELGNLVLWKGAQLFRISLDT